VEISHPKKRRGRLESYPSSSLLTFSMRKRETQPQISEQAAGKRKKEKGTRGDIQYELIVKKGWITLHPPGEKAQVASEVNFKG